MQNSMEGGLLDGGVYIPNSTREIKLNVSYDKKLAEAPESPRLLKKVVFCLDINLRVKKKGGSTPFRTHCGCSLFATAGMPCVQVSEVLQNINAYSDHNVTVREAMRVWHVPLRHFLHNNCRRPRDTTVYGVNSTRWQPLPRYHLELAGGHYCRQCFNRCARREDFC